MQHSDSSSDNSGFQDTGNDGKVYDLTIHDAPQITTENAARHSSWLETKFSSSGRPLHAIAGAKWHRMRAYTALVPKTEDIEDDPYPHLPNLIIRIRAQQVFGRKCGWTIRVSFNYRDFRKMDKMALRNGPVFLTSKDARVAAAELITNKNMLLKLVSLSCKPDTPGGSIKKRRANLFKLPNAHTFKEAYGILREREGKIKAATFVETLGTIVADVEASKKRKRGNDDLWPAVDEPFDPDEVATPAHEDDDDDDDDSSSSSDVVVPRRRRKVRRNLDMSSSDVSRGNKVVFALGKAADAMSFIESNIYPTNMPGWTMVQPESLVIYSSGGQTFAIFKTSDA